MAEDGISMAYLTKSGNAPNTDVPISSYKSNDEEILAHFGKRQQLKRNFNLTSIVGLTCTLMVTWEGILALFQPIVLNGGPTGSFAAFLFVFAGVLMQVLVMAEMASMIPLSGGQYNWVAVLSPPSYSKFLSYITGWVTTIAWQASTASTTFLNATFIQALVVLNYPDYVFERWHGTLIFYAVIALAVLATTYFGRLFPQFEAIVLFLHIAAFFGTLITLVYISPKSAPKDVFQQFINGGGFNTDGQSFLVGSASIMFTFIGIDGAAHMAEEIEHAAVAIPRSMIISVLLNGCMGFAILTTLLFVLGSIDEVLQSTFSFPFIILIEMVTSSRTGTTVMTAFILVVTIASSIGTLATSSRMLWAFAREGGVPGWQIISKVEHRTALPLWSIGISALINLLLSLINIGSTEAFHAFTGLGVAGFYSAFLISAAVMLYRRLTTPESEILWGPFKLGRAGVPITIVAMCYSVVGWFFSFWPDTQAISAATFNWSVVVYLSTLLVAMIWWVVYARKSYTGPKIEIKSVRPLVR